MSTVPAAPAPPLRTSGGAPVRRMLVTVLAVSLAVALVPGSASAGEVFTDVGSTSEHGPAIEALAEAEIVFGYGDGTFGPWDSITRGQIASILARAEGLDPVTPDFSDVPAGSTHAGAIGALAELGVIRGYDDGTFRPRNDIRRDHMALLIARWLGVEPVADGPFTDVSRYEGEINALYEIGVVNGTTATTFSPDRNLSRGQAASLVYRALDVLVDEVEITLLHDTHFHGKFESSGVGIAEYFGFAQERKDAAEGHAFFVANGDDIAPSLLSGVFEPNGIHMIEALNEAPVDVNTLGNHEFDFGPDNLRTLLEESDTTWVSANVRDADAPDQPFAKDLGVETFVLRSAGHVTVGFTGLAPENMDTITSLSLPGDDSAAVQIPALDALEEVVPEMRAAGADVIVVASHLCGTRAIEIADVYDGVDVFVGDHCAQILEEPYVSDNGTIVSLAFHEFDHMGELTLTVDKRGRGNGPASIVGHEFELHDLTDRDDLPVNQAIQDIVDRYDAQLDEELNVVIGERSVDWDTRVGVVRTGETAFGNFLTDEMRAFHDADIAVQNSGGIRADSVFPAGDITRREVAEILPFANHLVKAEIQGSTILEALERSVDTFPDPSGAFLQVSGMEFTFDPSQPAGSRVVEVSIGGEPLDEGRTYTMATNDFTLGGGDAYTMFRDDTTVLVDSNEGPLLSTFLINRIEGRTSPVDTDVEGRITTVD